MILHWFNVQEWNWFLMQINCIQIEWFGRPYFWCLHRVAFSFNHSCSFLRIHSMHGIISFSKREKDSAFKSNQIFKIYLATLTLKLVLSSVSMSMKSRDFNRFSRNSRYKTKKRNSATKLCQSKVTAVYRVLVYRKAIAENWLKMLKLFSMQLPQCDSMRNWNWHWQSMWMAQEKSCYCQKPWNPWW